MWNIGGVTVGHSLGCCTGGCARRVTSRWGWAVSGLSPGLGWRGHKGDSIREKDYRFAHKEFVGSGVTFVESACEAPT